MSIGRVPKLLLGTTIFWEFGEGTNMIGVAP